MSRSAVVELLIGIGETVLELARKRRKGRPVPPRVDVVPIKTPPTIYPSAMVDDGDGKPRVF